MVSDLSFWDANSPVPAVLFTVNQDQDFVDSKSAVKYSLIRNNTICVAVVCTHIHTHTHTHTHTHAEFKVWCEKKAIPVTGVVVWVAAGVVTGASVVTLLAWKQAYWLVRVMTCRCQSSGQMHNLKTHGWPFTENYTKLTHLVAGVRHFFF